MRPAQEELLSVVDRIFADGIVNASERSELVSLYRDAGLTVAEVREVFTAFLEKTWGEAIADGAFTDDERKKLATIVRELNVPADCVPAIVGIVVRAA
jgi:tellurite resistance protein